jgi:hypothetical protein
MSTPIIPPTPYTIEPQMEGLCWVLDANGEMIAATRSIEFAREVAVLPILLHEAREIIRKVECGETRSVRTYVAMKRVIQIVEGKA